MSIIKKEMNTSNGKPTQSASDAVGDWRAELQRKRIIQKIMDTLKRQIPFSKHERLQELQRIAERVEEEIYTAATSQSEYSRKICFMMLTMETRLQNPMSDPLLSNSVALFKNVNPAVRLDVTATTGNPNSGDWQEEVYQKIKAMRDLYLLDSAAQSSNRNGEDWQEEMYQKIKAMKDLYLPDLNDMHQKVLSKLQQHLWPPSQSENLPLEKLKVFNNLLECFIQFLQIPKHRVLANHKDKLGTFEKQIINVINMYRQKQASPQQQVQAPPPPHMQSLQGSHQTHSQLTQVQSHDQLMQQQQQQHQFHQVQSHENQMNLQGLMTPMQPNNMGNLQQNTVSLSGSQVMQQVNNHALNLMSDPVQSNSAANSLNPSVPFDSTAQIVHPNGTEWREEVYQKIKAMRDLYILYMNNTRQELRSKSQQDSLPQQLINEELERLEVIKNVFLRYVQFVQVPEHERSANYKDELGTYEMEIVDVLRENRWSQAATHQQGYELPSPDMQSLPE